MRRSWCTVLLVLPLYASGGAWADVTEADFRVETTRNLTNLCNASPEDARYREALPFCYAYLVGAYDAHVAENAGPDGVSLVCLPKPPPSRTQVVTAFGAWAREHPQYMNEVPVETVFRFLIGTWPCRTPTGKGGAR